MDVESIKRRYLPGDELARELGALAKAIEGEPAGELAARALRLLRATTGFRANLRRHLEPVEPPGFTFSCNRCGDCCESLVIGVSIDDVERYITNRHFWLLPFITLSDDRPTFRFMNVSMLAGVQLVYPPMLIDAVKVINPSLDRRLATSGSACIFHDAEGRRCCIHVIRPLECRLYPVANRLVHEQNILCEPSMFTTGPGGVDARFLKDYDVKRVSDVAYSALYNLNPCRGWRASVFKLAVIFHELAHAVDPATVLPRDRA